MLVMRLESVRCSVVSDTATRLPTPVAKTSIDRKIMKASCMR